MTAEKDLRDNTKAMNNLAQQMATFNKVAAELNKNLQNLAKIQSTEPRTDPFQAYVTGE